MQVMKHNLAFYHQNL